MQRKQGLTLLLLALTLAAPAGAEMKLPAGFASQLYVGGQGFEAAGTRGSPGIPAVSTLAFDHTGSLYLARTGRRYWSGTGESDADDFWPLYRIPPGGARLTPETETRFFQGPPLRNPQVATIRAGRDLFVTTFDRERRIGVLYRLSDGRPELFAGGTSLGGAPALLRQPEGAAVDGAGNLYVADRHQGAIVRLDSTGRVLDARWAAITRPRVLAMDERDQLWIGADGPAEAPWQRGPGEIWRIGREGAATLLLRGPVPAGIALTPAGHLLVADRQAAVIFALTAEGRRVDLVTFTEGDAPRGLTVAPDTPATRRAGIAGDLFLVLINRGAWPVNDVVRISGPLDELIRRRAGE